MVGISDFHIKKWTIVLVIIICLFSEQITAGYGTNTLALCKIGCDLLVLK